MEKDQVRDEFVDDETFASQAPETANSEAKPFENQNVDPDKCAEMLEALSPPQTMAALAEDRTILLIAPAGTGKTRTLTARTAHLYASGMKPSSVLTCTYTNAAAQELKDRLAPVLRVPVDDLWIGTIHSIGLRILRAHAQDLGLTGADSIVDEEQGIQIIARILREIGHHSVDSPDEKMTIKRCLRFIEDAKSRQISPASAKKAFDERSLDWASGIGEEEVEVYVRYAEFLQLYDMIDYNDMLFLTTHLLETNKEVGDRWRSKFDAILIDEYQDLSMSQIRLIRNLVDKERTSVFCAADDDQTIYQWRGSSLESTVKFERYWPGAKILHLTDNYRTPKSIFDTASRLISHVSDRHEKKIRTRNNPKALVRVIEAPDPATEKQKILEAMLDGMRAFNVPPERVAVLCRTNKLCQEMATFLAANGIAVNMHEGLPLNTQPVATLIAWMQLATRADNPIMFERAALYPEPLLDQGLIREVEQRVQKRNQESAAFNRELRKSGEAGEPRKLIGPIGYMIDMDDRRKIPDGSGGKRFVTQVREVREMLDPQKKLSSPFARIGDHVGIKAAVAVSERAEDHAYSRFVTLADEMVEQIGLEKTLASLTSLDFNAGQTGVNITTMHGAKGLEFDLVFAPGWEEGEFPSRQRETGDSIDEERRLAYVTISRAMQMLVISWSMSRKGQARPSRFISEMGIGSTGGAGEVA